MSYLFNLVLEVLALNKVGDIILLVVLLIALLLLHVLVALSELAQGSEGVGAELVEDVGDELSELLLLAVAVEGEGVGGDSAVDCEKKKSWLVRDFLGDLNDTAEAGAGARTRNGASTYHGGWRSG